MGLVSLTAGFTEKEKTNFPYFTKHDVGRKLLSFDSNNVFRDLLYLDPSRQRQTSMTCVTLSCEIDGLESRVDMIPKISV